MSDNFESQFGSGWNHDLFPPSDSPPADATDPGTGTMLRQPPREDLQLAGSPWGHSFADLLGNPALAACSSLGLCPAGRNADAIAAAAQLGEWMVEQVEGVVLLVEADLWRPGLAGLLGAPGGPGLTDAALNSEMSLEEVVHQTHIARLNLLPAGKPLPRKMRRTVASSFQAHFVRLSARFSSVIVTLPSASDPECALFPFSLAQAVLLVVQPQQTSVREIQMASRRLREAGASLVGTVINEAAGVLTRA